MATSLGTPLLVLGIVLLAAGLGAVYFAQADAGDNEEQPFSDDDEDRADRNEQLRTAGFVGAGLGIVLALVGVVAMVARRA